ncbi:MAG: GatB/YqeY domain-containing protein [Candidatus Peregrinibacteria bacterium]
MQNLKEKIIADLTAAMKAREELKTSTIRMLKAEIMKFEVSGVDKVATDEVVVDLIKKGIKQRREASEGFTKGGNQASSEKELAEIKILEVYLPAQMNEDALKEIVKQVIAEMKATPADFGKVMGAVMGKVKGKADGNLVSKAVKELLQNI